MFALTDRTVRTVISANVSQYLASMQRVKAATRDATEQLNRETTKNRQHWETVGKAAIVAGGAIGAGLGMAVVESAQFRKELSAMGAVSGATAQQLDRVGQAALEAGADANLAGVSASGAAKAATELARAGVETADVLGGALTGSLQLAVAGQMDQAEAAITAAQALNVFNLEGSETSHVADVLAAAANKSASTVGDLGVGMRQAGLVAAQTGLTLEDTVGTLALFADNALVGSDAGTSLRTMLMRLNPQSDEAAELMEQLGFTAFDAQGEFIGLEALAGELSQAFGNMSTEQRNAAMATIFGQDAIRAANVLYEAGEESVSEYVDAVNDVGAASRMAAAMTDNLAGDFEALQGAIETAMIETGGDADGVLRALTQSATGLVNEFNELPDGVRQASVALAAAAAAAGLLGGAALILIPRLFALQTSLNAMGATRAAAGIGTLATGMTKAMGPLSIFGAAVGTLALGLAQMRQAARDAGEALSSELTTGLRDVEIQRMLSDLADEVGGGFMSRFTNSSAEQFGRALRETLEGIADPALREQILEQAVAMGKVEEVTDRFGNTTYRTKAAVGDFLPTVVTTREELDDLAAAEAQAAYDAYNYATSAAGAAEYQRQQAATSEDLTGATDDLAAATDELTASQQAQVDKYGRVLDMFGEMGTSFSDYDSWLTSMNEAERASAEATAEATDDKEDSWEDYFNEVPKNAETYLQSLRDQVAEQETWAENIAKAQQLGFDMLRDQIIEAGPEQNELFSGVLDQDVERIAEYEEELEAGQRAAMDAMVAAINEEGPDLVDEHGNVTREAVTAMEEQWDLAPGLARAMLEDSAAVAEDRKSLLVGALRSAGQDSAAAMIEELEAGTSEIERVIDGYTAAIAAGVEPLILQLGGTTRVIHDSRTSGPLRYRADGGITDFYADGGMREQHVAQIARPGDWRVWAEPETGGEAYIPLAPAKRQRSLAIWEETGRRLQAFAPGGFWAPDDVPQPPSFAPFGPPLVTPARLGAQRVYDEAYKFVEENAAPQLGEGIGYQAMFAALRGMFPGVRLISGFRPGARTSSGAVSYHARGRAVDFDPSMAMAEWINQHYFGQTRELITPWQHLNIHNGRRHSFSNGVMALHDGRIGIRHNHWAMREGGILNPHVRDAGGPLEPGWTFNGTGRNEMVVPFADGGVTSPDRFRDARSIAEALLWGPRAAASNLGLSSYGRYRDASGARMSSEAMVNRMQDLYDAAPLAEQQRILSRLLRETDLYSDLWVRIRDEQQRVNEAVRDRWRSRVDERMAAQEDFRELYADQLEAERAHQQRISDIQAKYADDRAEAQRRRTEQLMGYRSLDQGRFGAVTAGTYVDAGGTATQESFGAALLREIRQQTRELDAFRTGVQELRAGGASEALIEQLGIDDPSSLGRIRDLLATPDLLDDLSAAVAGRGAAAGRVTSYEVAGGYGQVSRDLTGLLSARDSTLSQMVSQMQASTDKQFQQMGELIKAANLANRSLTVWIDGKPVSAIARGEINGLVRSWDQEAAQAGALG